MCIRDRCGIILDQTSFYAEAGGQIYDTGIMVKENANQEDDEIEVNDVQQHGGYVVHLGKVASGTVKVGDVFKLQIDEVIQLNCN